MVASSREIASFRFQTPQLFFRFRMENRRNTKVRFLNRIILVLSLAVIPLSTHATIHAYPNPDSLYEAEKTKYQYVDLLEDHSASGGYFLHIGNSGQIAWTVNAREAGWHNLNFCYRAPDGEKEEFILRNGYQFATGFRFSKEWNIHKASTYLNRGLNTIELKKSWGNIDIDYLQIEPVELKPELKPYKNIFCKAYPRDIVFNVNRYGSTIEHVEVDGRETTYSLSDYIYFEDAVNIKIAKEHLLNLHAGDHSIQIRFVGNTVLDAKLKVEESIKPAALIILAPYVEHGKAVIFILPNGKTMLVDCGKEWVRDSLLIPFLFRNNIRKLDYFIITHYHEDHDSGDKGEKIKNLFKPEYFYDNRNLKSGDILDLGGVQLKVLNSFADGTDENTSSLAFNLTYNGFTYQDGGDTYAVNQEMIMKRFPEDVYADLFSANHHFHGSVSSEYLRRMNPSVVFTQSQEAIYARSAYMEDFRRDVVKFLNEKKLHSIEDLANHEVGTIVFRINGKDDWSYETYSGYTNEEVIPYLWK